MKHFINSVQQPRLVLNKTQAFFDQEVEVPQALARKIIKVQEDADVTSRYLKAVEAMYKTRGSVDITTLEVPECLQDVAVKESKPRKKVTAAASKSKSQIKRKKIQSKPCTSPLKPASSG